MYHANGIGLAAVQIGVTQRIFVVDIEGIEPCPLVCINPVVKKISRDTVETEEGCLSIPGVKLPVRRPRSLFLEYTNPQGKLHLLEAADDLLSTCIQHEIDHLEGILFLDRLHKKHHKQAIKDLDQNKLMPYFDLSQKSIPKT